MSPGAHCFVTRELAPVTRGGIGEAIRSRIESAGGDSPSLVLLDLPAALVRRARADCSGSVVIRGVEELVPRSLPLHVFASEAYWRSYRIWLALRVLQREQAIELVEFPDYEGLGFVAIKTARLGLDRDPPPIVVRIHGTGEWAARADRRPLVSLEERQRAHMERYALRHADAVIAPSQAVLDAMRDDYDLPDEIRIEPPAPRSLPIGLASSGPDGPPGLPLVVGFLGKLQPLKGPQVLVDAAVALLRSNAGRGVEVHFVGGDERGRWGSSHLAELKARIPPELIPLFHFHGALPRDRALAQMLRCHAVVSPSRMETFGLAVHELAALGLPMALSDIPAFRADFENVPGIDLFPPDDSSRLRGILERWRGELERGEWSRTRPERRDGISGDRHDRVSAIPSVSDIPRRGFGAALEGARTPSGPDSNPRVSIIVPFFEMHDYIDDCLRSIETDSFPSTEVLIVDDGSASRDAHRKLEALRLRAQAQPGLSVLSKPNGGLGSARNLGIEHARGEFLLMLDPDDLLVDGYLAAAVMALDRCPELAFVACISSLFEDGRAPDSGRDWIVPYDPDFAMLLYENGAGTAASVFRRRVFESVRYREDLPAYEDWDLHLAIARSGEVGEMLPVVFHRYRQRANGLSRLAHRNHDRLLATVLEPHLEGVDPALREALEIYLASVTRLRGLGGGRREFPAVRVRVADTLESFYRRRLKAWLGRNVPDETRERIVARARRLLRGTAGRS